MKLIAKFLLIALVIFSIQRLVPGITVSTFYTAILVALVLALLNLLVRPVLFILTLPITILTLGLFFFVLNALMFYFASTIVKGFTISGPVPALLGSLIVTIASWLIDRLFGKV
jgi:putative membrane protein